ncbi:uncharacterized protein LOC144356563 isoform X1 [Saccoglossus kowalevskii]
MSRSALESAFIDVSEKKMSIRKAAAKWEIKRSTLGDRVSGRTQFGRRSGPPPFLTTEEETQVADWIIGMAERGFGVTKKQLLYTVKKILDTNKKVTPLIKIDPPNLPGNKWYRQFIKRNPRVKTINTGKQQPLTTPPQPSTSQEHSLPQQSHISTTHKSCLPSILTYPPPRARKNNTPKKKKSRCPNFVNGSTALMNHQEEHLQFHRDVASKHPQVKERAGQKQMTRKYAEKKEQD